MATKSNLFLGSVAPRTGSWHADATEPQLLLITDPVSREMWKLVKLFVFGTKVLSLIPRLFHHNTLKEIWPVLVLDLVS